MTQDDDDPKFVQVAAVSASSPSAIPHVSVASVQHGRLEPGKVVQWNTSSLGLRVAADLTSAATASALIAPIISVIDRLVSQPFYLDLVN